MISDFLALQLSSSFLIQSTCKGRGVTISQGMQAHILEEKKV